MATPHFFQGGATGAWDESDGTNLVNWWTDAGHTVPRPLVDGVPGADDTIYLDSSPVSGSPVAPTAFVHVYVTAESVTIPDNVQGPITVTGAYCIATDEKTGVLVIGALGSIAEGAFSGAYTILNTGTSITGGEFTGKGKCSSTTIATSAAVTIADLEFTGTLTVDYTVGEPDITCYPTSAAAQMVSVSGFIGTMNTSRMPSGGVLVMP